METEWRMDECEGRARAQGWAVRGGGGRLGSAGLRAVGQREPPCGGDGLRPPDGARDGRDEPGVVRTTQMSE